MYTGNLPYVVYGNAVEGFNGKSFLFNRRYSSSAGHKQIHILHGQPRYRRHFPLGASGTIGTRLLPQSKILIIVYRFVYVSWRPTLLRIFLFITLDKTFVAKLLTPLGFS